MSDPPRSFESEIPDEWIEELQPRLDFLGRKLLVGREFAELESLLLEGLKKRVRLSVFSALFYIATLLVGALLLVFVDGVGSTFLMFMFAGTGLVSWLRDAFDVKRRLETHAMVQAVRRRAVARNRDSFLRSHAERSACELPRLAGRVRGGTIGSMVSRRAQRASRRGSGRDRQSFNVRCPQPMLRGSLPGGRCLSRAVPLARN